MIRSWLASILTLSLFGLSACQAEAKPISEIDCSSPNSGEVWEKISFYSDGTVTLIYLPYDDSEKTVSKGIVFSKTANGLVLYSALNERERHCRWEIDSSLTSANFQCGISPITKFNSESAINALTCEKTTNA